MALTSNDVAETVGEALWSSGEPLRAGRDAVPGGRVYGITSLTPHSSFGLSQARVDPKVATPAEIMRARKLAIGHQVEGLTGGLEAK